MVVSKKDSVLLKKKEKLSWKEFESLSSREKNWFLENKRSAVPKKEWVVSEQGISNAFFVGVLLLVFSFLFFDFLSQFNSFFPWVFIVLGIVLFANGVLLRFSFAKPFIFPYFLTMLKTKHFINFIESIAHFGKLLEKLWILCSIFGFGLVAVDFWFARKLGGVKRVLLLVVSGLLLGVFYYYSMWIVFSVPVFQPLFFPSLVAFVFLGFGGMSLVLLLGYGLLAFLGLFVEKQLCPSIAPVLPGVPLPGLGVVIPAVGWVSLVLVLVIHELSHGVMLAFYREKIKSVGLLVAGIVPMGAFVEQDDDTFENLDEKKSLLVLSAGPGSNLVSIIMGVLLLFALFFAASPLFEQFDKENEKAFGGVMIVTVEDMVSFCGIDVNAPAKGKLFPQDRVLKINGVDVNGIALVNQLFRDSNGEIIFLVSRLDSNSGKFIDLNVSVVPYRFEDLGIKRIGVEFGIIPNGYEINPWLVLISNFFGSILMILLLFVVISFAAGSFNYFPSDPFDGGRMAKIMLAPYFSFLGFNRKETYKFIGRLFMWLLIISLTLNLIPYLTMFT